MIKSNLAVLMAERGLKIKDVHLATGITRNTLSTLYHNTSQGVQFDTLDKLCEYFKVSPNDLFIYEPFKYDFDVSQVNDSYIAPRGKVDMFFLIQAQIQYKNHVIKGEIEALIDIACEPSLDDEDIVENLSITLNYPDNISSILSEIHRLFIKSMEDEIIETIKDKLIGLDYILSENLSTYIR